MRILIVEDNPADFRLLQAMLGEVPYAFFKLFHEKRLAGGINRLVQGKVDVALLDLGLPDSQGLETFTSLHAAAPHIPMIILSGDDNEDWAVEAVRNGAQDYLMHAGRCAGDAPTMVTATAAQLRCQHLGEADFHPYLCVPLSAQARPWDYYIRRRGRAR